MRLLALSAAALIASGTAAFAAPAAVTVDVAPKLQKEFEKTYGLREAKLLTEDLRSSVEQRLAKTGALEDARVELTLKDVKPNRPTFKQLSDRPGLSMQSFGIGGATIEGRIVAPDGTVTPVEYSWYESDIRDAYANWTWSDAEWTFDRFAGRLARGAQVAQR